MLFVEKQVTGAKLELQFLTNVVFRFVITLLPRLAANFIGTASQNARLKELVEMIFSFGGQAISKTYGDC